MNMQLHEYRYLCCMLYIRVQPNIPSPAEHDACKIRVTDFLHWKYVCFQPLALTYQNGELIMPF